MSNLREAAVQALDALDEAANLCTWDGFALAAYTLRAALAEPVQKPDRAECDGGTCGLGGYCDQCPKAEQALNRMAEHAREVGLDYEPTRGDRMRDKGFTRRPTLREIAVDEPLTTGDKVSPTEPVRIIESGIQGDKE